MRYKLSVKSRKLRDKNIVTAMLLLACIFYLSSTMAQESINATGGNATGSGGSVCYSVGQVVYTTNTGTNGSLDQGVQQPFEIWVVTGIEEANGIKLSVYAYPNPTADYLILEVKDFNFSTLTFELYDLHGKLLQTQKITGSQTNIVMNNQQQRCFSNEHASWNADQHFTRFGNGNSGVC
ncbi:MAG: T9SS type A sorting domain-containing protein [Lentimicrobiaceae bacterium]|jgi:hypothetical protein|nr:T9SS type A sorting domain-containing protein [Lentimicrobiaceae bacterium]MDD4597376.1 T9SS type A sorting domain-containing protein [Lentimicrobiaceae bacterium]HAH56960.1 T9SS C-terminal target domain-containing protein [Bacteroidales bacterium]